MEKKQRYDFEEVFSKQYAIASSNMTIRLIEYLKKETGHSEDVIKRTLNSNEFKRQFSEILNNNPL